MLLTLPGTPFLYQGECLGLVDATVPPDRVVDPGGRDGCRAPMPWMAASNHGWPTDPWLPFAPEGETRNVETLRQDPTSILHLYRTLLQLRRAHADLQIGTFAWLDSGQRTGADDVLAYRRREEWIVVLNLGEQPFDLADDVLVSVATVPELAGTTVRRVAPGTAVVGRRS